MRSKRMLKPGEVAGIFSVSLYSLYRWEKEGAGGEPPQLVPVRPSGQRGQRRYKWADVEALATKRGIEAVHPDDVEDGG